jgi:hypothetical protein
MAGHTGFIQTKPLRGKERARRERLLHAFPVVTKKMEENLKGLLVGESASVYQEDLYRLKELYESFLGNELMHDASIVPFFRRDREGHKVNSLLSSETIVRLSQFFSRGLYSINFALHKAQVRLPKSLELLHQEFTGAELGVYQQEWFSPLTYLQDRPWTPRYA